VEGGFFVVREGQNAQWTVADAVAPEVAVCVLAPQWHIHTH
jgi:hypothetical protein